jgi:hypothetical protein
MSIPGNDLKAIKEFVQFVASQKLTYEHQKTDAGLLLGFLQNFNSQQYNAMWNASIDIFDRDLQDRKVIRNTPYHRTWNVYFENDRLEAETGSFIDSVPPNDIYKSHFTFYYTYYFETDERYITDGLSLTDFLKDAYNYKSYITEHLNDVEIEIEFN